MDHPPTFKGDRPVGQGECEVQVMVDNDDRNLMAELVETLEKLLDDGWSKTLEGLVQEQHLDVAREGACDCHHLLLAAGKEIRRGVEPLTDPREVLEDLVHIPPDAMTGFSLEPSELKILSHSHSGKEAAPLRHIANSQTRDLRRRTAGDLPAIESDRA